MSSVARPHTAPRPRVVADAPVEALVVRADELARRWAIALILALPLERLGELPLESFAREAPLLCAQVVRALSSDEQLDQICDGSARAAGGGPPGLRLAEVTGARDSTAVVEAMEALRGVLWDALVDEVGCSSAERSATREMADLADRLAYVCSSAAACSLSAPAPSARPQFVGRAANGAASSPRKAGPREPELGEPARREPAAREPALREPVLSPLRAGEPAAHPSLLLADGVSIVDEAPPPPPRIWRAVDREHARSGGERVTGATPPAAAPRKRTPRARPLPWDPPLRSQPRRSRYDPGG